MNNKVHSAVTSEKTVLGFRPADLLGILIMIIPCVISYCWQEEIPIKILGFIEYGHRQFCRCFLCSLDYSL